MPKILLEAGSVELSFGPRTILEIKELKIYDGDRIGLIGENGAGKTTLLRVLSGEREPDAGIVRRFSEIAIIRQMGDADGESDARLRSEFDAQEHREGLSGGEQTRRRIAAALSRRAHLLFADEPTTDLDAEGAAQLRRELAAYDGAMVLVSHDRSLLDALCTKIWHLENGEITEFPGNYTDYRAELERRRAFQQFEYEQYRGEQARLRASIQGNRERAGQMKKAPTRMGNSEARLHKMETRQISEQLHKARRQLESRLSHMEVKERPREDAAVRMELGASRPVAAKAALEVRGLRLRAGEKSLLAGAALTLPTGTRTALVGPNGCGKTTLMRALAGRAAGDGRLLVGEAEGSSDRAIRFNPAVRVGWFDQSHQSTLDPGRSALENVMRQSAHAESDVRTVLARLNLRGDDVFKPVGVLSGGERGRVALAKLLLSEANLLLLDEPTNHLDVFALEALQEMLSGYRGTLLFVSHDAAFSEAVATRFARFEGEKLVSFEETQARQAEREQRDRAAEQAQLEISVLQMRMADLAARMSAPRRGDSPEKLNAEYQALAEQVRALKNPAR